MWSCGVVKATSVRIMLFSFKGCKSCNKIKAYKLMGGIIDTLCVFCLDIWFFYLFLGYYMILLEMTGLKLKQPHLHLSAAACFYLPSERQVQSHTHSFKGLSTLFFQGSVSLRLSGCHILITNKKQAWLFFFFPFCRSTHHQAEEGIQNSVHPQIRKSTRIQTSPVLIMCVNVCKWRSFSSLLLI